MLPYTPGTERLEGLGGTSIARKHERHDWVSRQDLYLQLPVYPGVHERCQWRMDDQCCQSL